MSRRGACAIAAALLLASAAGGCGEDAGEVVAETAGNLGDIRSGRLDMTMAVDGRGKGTEGGDVGFELAGPFAVSRRGGLPRADIRYTQLAGGKRATVRLVATGDAAFVEVDGQAYELAEEQARKFRLGTRGLGSVGAEQELRIRSWVRNPKLSDGGAVGGAETDRVSGELDVVAAAADLARLSRALGPGDDAGLRALEQGADQLEQAAEHSSFDLWTGKDDRLLRRLRIAVELGVGGGLGAAIRFDLRVARPNEPIRVQAPEQALPATSLPSG